MNKTQFIKQVAEGSGTETRIAFPGCRIGKDRWHCIEIVWNVPNRSKICFFETGGVSKRTFVYKYIRLFRPKRRSNCASQG